MRNLELIRADFESIKSEAEVKPVSINLKLVELMNELEHDYHAMIINPTKEQWLSPEVKLYREISETRKF